MRRQLNELTKKELIEVIQDYQEMVSEIEEYLNKNQIVARTENSIRDILEKTLRMENS